MIQAWVLGRQNRGMLAKNLDEIKQQQGQTRMTDGKGHTLVLRTKSDTAEGELSQLSTAQHKSFSKFSFIFLLTKQLLSGMKTTKIDFSGAREITKIHNPFSQQKATKFK